MQDPILEEPPVEETSAEEPVEAPAEDEPESAEAPAAE